MAYARAPLHLVAAESQEVPPIAPDVSAKIQRHQLTAMEWIERKTQPYIVWIMSISAALRTVFVFTDRIVDLSKLGVFNAGLNVTTGIALALISDLTIVIAGRRRKLFNQKLFAAKLAKASAKKNQVELWGVEVARLQEQMRANNTAMWLAMFMSIYASATYLITSSGTVGFLGTLGASAIAAYTLFLGYFHAVQTDEIKEDGTQEVSDLISENLNLLRVEEIARIRAEFAVGRANMAVPARLALIAGGLSVPEQRRIMPTLSLLLRAPGETESDDEEDETTRWYSVRDIAVMLRESGKSTISLDNIMRNVRRRLADNAEKHQEVIRLVSARGWVAEPAFAIDFFSLPAPIDETQGEHTIIESTVESLAD
jgi:hypothetical protein